MFEFLKRKRKPKTVLDQMIFAIYGNPPPKKTAVLPDAVQIAAEDLLANCIERQAVADLAAELHSGPMPYSTHDLAVSVSLAFFKRPELRRELWDAQLMARLRVASWAREKKIPPLLAASFEEVLYKAYLP